LIETSLPASQGSSKVFLTLYGQGQGLWTCGHNSYLNYLLERAGLQNVASGLEGNWFAYNPEKLIADNPELILILAGNKEAFQQATNWLESVPPLKDINAIKNRNFVFLDENLFSRFGPRLIDAFNWLVKAVYFPAEQEENEPRHRNWFFPVSLILLTLAGFLLSVKLGAVRMTWQEIWAGLFSGGQFKDILIHLRLPRAILAYLVGAALALSGAILQGYFRNPLADPFILGVSSGASLGAVLSLEIGLTWTVFGFSSQSWLLF